MINLLPPEIKLQIAYSRRNAGLMRYLWLTVITLGVVSVVFAGAQIYLNQQIQTTSQEVASKREKIESYKGVEEQARGVDQRLKSIKTIQATQARFSIVLTEIATYLPKGAYLNDITLTGDDKKPVRISITANSYNEAVAVREGLARSARINAVDIEAIGSPQGDTFSATLAIAFKPGQAR